MASDDGSSLLGIPGAWVSKESDPDSSFPAPLTPPSRAKPAYIRTSLKEPPTLSPSRDPLPSMPIVATSGPHESDLRVKRATVIIPANPGTAAGVIPQVRNIQYVSRSLGKHRCLRLEYPVTVRRCIQHIQYLSFLSHRRPSISFACTTHRNIDGEHNSNLLWHHGTPSKVRSRLRLFISSGRPCVQSVFLARLTRLLGDRRFSLLGVHRPYPNHSFARTRLAPPKLPHFGRATARTSLHLFFRGGR